MSGRAMRLGCAAAIAGCVLISAPGCYIRRGFALHWNWSLHAHRYRCNGPDCGGGEPVAATDSAVCTDCPNQGECRGVKHLRAAEGPPPLASEMSPDPEPAGPSYFHPVPTRPVFGPRSEQPDAIEGQSLLPVPAPSHDAEPMIPMLPPPASDDSEKTDEGSLEQEPNHGGPGADSSTGLRRLPSDGDAQPAGWKAAKKGLVEPKRIRSTSRGHKPLASVPEKSSGVKKKSLPCPHCSVTFKPKPRTNNSDD